VLIDTTYQICGKHSLELLKSIIKVEHTKEALSSIGRRRALPLSASGADRIC